MGKRSEIAIQYLIYAALGLIVLVIILSIFGTRMGFFGKSIGGTCEEQGGKCADDDGGTDDKRCEDDDYPIKIWAKGCPTKTDAKDGWCCLSLE